MHISRKVPAALIAALALLGAGCQSDDAAEKDIKNATEDVKDAGKEAGKEIDEAADDIGKKGEKAAPGDADDDGK